MLKEILELTTQKGINLKEVYNVVRNESDLTKVEIAEKTNLKFSTCARLIEELVEIGLLYESGEAHSSGGRKAKKYAITSTTNYVVGIDISRTFSKVLLMTLDLNPIEEQRFEMNETSTPDVMIKFYINTIHTMLKKNGIEESSLLGIGISAIGPLDTKNGIIKKPLHFPASGWEDIPIVDRVKEYFDTEVVLDYGENSALSAEQRQGAAKSDSSIFHINKGVGIRLGIMLNGEILRPRGGDKGGAFGQGHMVVDIHGRKCTCGNYGCMNAYSTIPALVKEVKNHLKRGADSVIHDQVDNVSEVSFSHIVSAIEEKDQLCEQIVKDTAYYSGTGLANLITIFHPSKIILSGPMYRELKLFYDMSIETAMNRYKKLFPDLEVTFTQGELGENAAAIGAGGIVLDYLLSV
ncbi:ROK family transcriptional regulator [Oceanobacillus polygoni]|uniref:NBD/HSP70 family sugar kinase n=1 Tax=Oceanobacillus polygoni TaxID=1235259 RepID=A0A9X1CAN8_9BACI|nr:ROK family transcriptional regulator [Oceanobacillus polygoni]MBP2076046.1 putative NBD/HSP70 family sugar kinase [Oceanobacillus polygoni]